MEYRISKERLMELLESEARLQGMECGGVDNWGYYGEDGMFDAAEKLNEMSESESLALIKSLGHLQAWKIWD